jgi:hypothetical protein
MPPMRAAFRNRFPSWARTLGLILLGLAAVWSAAIWWLPAVLKPQVERLAGEALGRAVQIENIDFRPWTLELTVNGLVVRSQDGSSEQFSVRQLYANLASASLVKLGPVIDALSVDQPRLHLRQLAPGRYDIDDILARLSVPSDHPSGEPLPFAISNLTLSGGQVDLADEVIGKTHTVRNLNLGLPFLSNFPAYHHVETEPRLAFQLNGSAFDSAANSTPFVSSRKTELNLKIQQLDLTPYLGYLPAGLPVALSAGVVDADIRLRFEQQPAVSLILDGQLSLQDVVVKDAAKGELLEVQRVALVIDELRPLERVARLASLDVVAPRLSVRRDAQGRLNLMPQGAQATAPATAGATTAPASAASAPQSAASPSAAPTWSFSLAKMQLQEGTVRWVDEAASPGRAADLQLGRLALQVDDLKWPFAQPLRLSGSAQLNASAVQGAVDQAGELTFSGSATDRAADVQVLLERTPLALAAPYLAGVLKPRLQGELSADMAVNWRADAGVVVAAERLTLAGLALDSGTRARSAAPASTVRPQEASIRTVELRKARVDVARQTVTAELLRIDRPRAQVSRAKQGGRWMYEDWLVAASPAAAATTVPKPASPAWTVSLAGLEIDDGAVAYADQSGARPVALGVSALKLRVRDLRSSLDKPMRMQLVATVGSGGTTPGRVGFTGQVTPNPLLVQGELDIRQFPVHALEPYFGDALNLRLTRADASYQGALRYAAGAAGPSVKLAGDLGVEDLRAEQGAGNGRDLLSWNALRLRGLGVDMAPGTTTAVVVRETALTDFYARVIVDETGRINLQDLTKPSVGSAASTGSVATTPAATASAGGGASDAAPPAASPVAAPAPAAASTATATATATTTTTATGPAPDIRFGPIELQNGRVLFSDRFVKPNYTANLTELNGRLSSFASAAPDGAAPALADLQLKGRAEGTASLDISGKLNPLAKPLALDIRAKVRDLELPPLSPYSVKYAGHGIERGKLSVDLHYEVLPNGQLTASNSLVLNQLTFGEPVPGAPASLPVRLATALLADRNGVIDLTLPIQGSLNDPQFSLGPVILKAIGNLILKAVTAPFSLLAGAFGGGGEALGQIDFAPGSAALDAAAEQKLDKVATALMNRPGLKMSVAGSASLDAERDGYKRARLQRMVQAEKRRQAGSGREAAGVTTAGADAPGNSDVSGTPGTPGTAGTSGSAAGPAASTAPRAPGATGRPAVVVSASEYPALLTSLYRRTDLAEKPRNVIGMAKDIPLAQMEQLLLDNMTVSEESIRNLAVQRGVAVRDYLASRQVPLERLFLGAPKAVTTDASWSPRADLDLATP